MPSSFPVAFRPWSRLTSFLIALMALVLSAVAEDAPMERFSGKVGAIEVSEGPDLVLCRGGSASGFRPGMILVVEPNGVPVAELIVIATRRNETAALITRISAGRDLIKGDPVRVKSRNASIL